MYNIEILLYKKILLYIIIIIHIRRLCNFLKYEYVTRMLLIEIEEYVI